MNIDDIESRLNNYEANTERVIAIILNTVAKNQAILESLLSNQLNLMHEVAPDIEINDLSKKLLEKIQINLARIQAEMSSQLE